VSDQPIAADRIGPDGIGLNRAVRLRGLHAPSATPRHPEPEEEENDRQSPEDSHTVRASIQVGDEQKKGRHEQARGDDQARSARGGRWSGEANRSLDHRVRFVEQTNGRGHDILRNPGLLDGCPPSCFGHGEPFGGKAWPAAIRTKNPAVPWVLESCERDLAVRTRIAGTDDHSRCHTASPGRVIPTMVPPPGNDRRETPEANAEDMILMPAWQMEHDI
jgi:hypothetical protein